MNTINCFFHPTSVAIIDDNRSFLEGIRLDLASSIPTMLYDIPSLAYEDISRKNRCGSAIKSMASVVDDYDIDFNNAHSRLISYDIKDIYKLIYSPTRFSKISTAVVDYEMPEMNGLDFCKKLGECGIRKIMLTGQATSDAAVDAFNDGLINKFIKKNSTGLIDSISSEQKTFFSSISKNFLDSISSDDDCFLKNEQYQLLFKRTLLNANACEYYMLDLSGSYLFLDEEANGTLLFVKSLEEMETYIQIARDNDAPQEIINAIKDKQSMVFMLNEDTPPSQWKKHLYKAEKLNGTNLYYSVVTPIDEIIPLRGVVSYKDYLKSL